MGLFMVLVVALKDRTHHTREVRGKKSKEKVKSNREAENKERVWRGEGAALVFIFSSLFR